MNWFPIILIVILIACLIALLVLPKDDEPEEKPKRKRSLTDRIVSGTANILKYWMVWCCIVPMILFVVFVIFMLLAGRF